VTAYVDDARNRLGRMVCCHMAADSEEEMHALAAAVGCRREWSQGWHYDLAAPRRRAAVLLGAAEVTARDMALMTARLRRGGPWPLLTPGEGREWLGLRAARAHIIGG
jgi:hypothetical protein